MTEESQYKWKYYTAGNMWVYRSGTEDELRIELRPTDRFSLNSFAVDFITSAGKQPLPRTFTTVQEAINYCSKMLSKGLDASTVTTLASLVAEVEGSKA